MVPTPSDLDEGGWGRIWPSHPLAARLDIHAQSRYFDGGGSQYKGEVNCLELGAKPDPHLPPKLCDMPAETMEQVNGEAAMVVLCTSKDDIWAHVELREEYSHHHQVLCLPAELSLERCGPNHLGNEGKKNDNTEEMWQGMCQGMITMEDDSKELDREEEYPKLGAGPLPQWNDAQGGLQPAMEGINALLPLARECVDKEQEEHFQRGIKAMLQQIKECMDQGTQRGCQNSGQHFLPAATEPTALSGGDGAPPTLDPGSLQGGRAPSEQDLMDMPEKTFCPTWGGLMLPKENAREITPLIGAGDPPTSDPGASSGSKGGKLPPSMSVELSSEEENMYKLPLTLDVGCSTPATELEPEPEPDLDPDPQRPDMYRTVRCPIRNGLEPWGECFIGAAMPPTPGAYKKIMSTLLTYRPRGRLIGSSYIKINENTGI